MICRVAACDGGGLPAPLARLLLDVYTHVGDVVVDIDDDITFAAAAARRHHALGGQRHLATLGHAAGYIDLILLRWPRPEVNPRLLLLACRALLGTAGVLVIAASARPNPAAPTSAPGRQRRPDTSTRARYRPGQAGAVRPYRPAVSSTMPITYEAMQLTSEKPSTFTEVRISASISVPTVRDTVPATRLTRTSRLRPTIAARTSTIPATTGAIANARLARSPSAQGETGL